jgi:GWxTD domain-containing protein
MIPALAFLFLLLISPLAGQTTARNVGFEVLRDSLTGTTDTNSLRATLKRARRSDPVRAGLIALRLGELRADPDFSEALSSFRQASRAHPERPEPWYGLALAEAGRSRWEMRDRLRLGSRVGLKTLQRSAEHYARALAADPRIVPAALALAQVELSLMDTARLRVASEILRRAARALPPGQPQLMLALGRVERAAGNLDSAAVAFERYLLTGGARAMGLLELARTRLALGRIDGEPPYYEGAALGDPRATAEYRTDLELIASEADLREFDRLKGWARASYLHRFWTDRDHIELRQEGERLREHYRRVLFARANFPLTVSRRFYGSMDAYRSGNNELDDRGVIYVRQGKPAERLRPFVFGLMPNESWRYVRAEGDLLFHFSAGYDDNGGGDLYDYRLVQSVLDLHGASDAPRDQLLLSRQTLSPMYSRMLNWGAYGSANATTLERNIGATSITIGTTTDSYELQYSRGLAAVADLVAVGQGPSGSLAHFVFGIAAATTMPQRVLGGAEYTIRVRLAVLDAHDRSVARLDTLVVIRRSRTLSKREFLVGRAELSLPPGRWKYRAALQQGDSSGVVLPKDSVRVASTDGILLGLSDIALGTPGRAATWVTGSSDTVLLAPSALFRRGKEVQIYYEVTGAKVQQVYRHEIAVLRPEGRKADSRRRPLVALSFDEEATSGVIRSRRTVRLERLKPGNYVVEVKVTASDGSTQMRRRAIQLIDR